MNRFILSEDEKKRILNLHESAVKRQYLPEQEEEIKQEESKDKSTSGDVRTNYDRTYDYKKDGDKYFYKLKNATDWKTASGKGLSGSPYEAIKNKVYGTGDPSKSGSNLGTSKTPFPFKDKVSGDKFRGWMNKYYPKASKVIDLWKSGPFNNSHMKNAWNTSLSKALSTQFGGVLTYGDLYNKQVLSQGQKSKTTETPETPKNPNVGKTAYIKTSDGVNVRTSPNRNTGNYNNLLQPSSFYKNYKGDSSGKIGEIVSARKSTDNDNKTWYKIKLILTPNRNQMYGYVREDVIKIK